MAMTAAKKAVKDCIVNWFSAIVSSIVLMASNLGMDVVAEGVEEEIQLELLEQSGCRHFQGYLFSRPVPHAEFVGLLEKQIKSRIRAV